MASPVLHPRFHLDRKARPVLVFESAGGSYRRAATFECYESGCLVFAFGPQPDGCVLALCPGGEVACPPHSTVRFRVCVECQGPPCLGVRRNNRPAPPRLLVRGRGTGNYGFSYYDTSTGTVVRKHSDCYLAGRPNPPVGDLTPDEFSFLIDGPPNFLGANTYSGVYRAAPYTAVNSGGETFPDWKFEVVLDYCLAVNALRLRCKGLGVTDPAGSYSALIFPSGGASAVGESLFQSDPFRHVFAVRGSAGEFQLDITEEGTPSYGACPPRPVSPADPDAEGCLTGGPPDDDYTGGVRFYRPPAVANGTPLRLTGPGGLNVTAPFAWTGTYAGAASFAVPAGGGTARSAVLRAARGQYHPNGPFDRECWVLAGLTNSFGGAETRPALTAANGPPFAATFETSEGDGYEVTSA